MTTSGNISWELTRDQLVIRAYAKLGIPGEDNTLTALQLADGVEALNSVVATAVTDGMPLWKRETISLTPSTTSQIYSVNDAVKIANVYLRDSAGVQYKINQKSLYDFMQLPRNSIGIPVHWTWAQGLQGGNLSIWPLTSDSTTVATKTLQVVYQAEFDGFTAAGETLDFPAYWTNAIIYKTASILAPEQGLPLPDRQQLMKEAETYWKQASDYGDEDGSMLIQPERRQR